MDIVRKNIESLNGRVEVTTRPGEGSTFTLHLPLTLATFRGLLVESAGTVYAIPLNYVQETVRPGGAALWTVTGQQAVNLRGSVMSPLRLDHELRRNGKASNGAEQEQCFLVVVKASDSDADRPVAIAVEALIDQQEVVVKSLSGYLGRARGIAGASILGDGQVVLILDIPVLIKAAQQRAQVDAVEGERRAS